MDIKPVASPAARIPDEPKPRPRVEEESREPKQAEAQERTPDREPNTSSVNVTA